MLRNVGSGSGKVSCSLWFWQKPMEFFVSLTWANGVPARKLEIGFQNFYFEDEAPDNPIPSVTVIVLRSKDDAVRAVRGKSILFLVNLNDLKMWENTVNSKDCERPADKLTTELHAN
jgi:hypothetical protein